MRYIFLLVSYVVLALSEPVHSSVSSFYQNMEFKNSKQKTDGKTVGIGADLHDQSNEYRILYTNTHTSTKQPPLDDDLYVEKLFFRYAYDLKNSFKLNLNYINVLKDNMVPTEHGKVYGAGLTYMPNKAFSVNLTQFISDYSDFDVYQSDLTFDVKMKLEDIKVKFTSATNYISLDGFENDAFTRNADKEYLTTALKLHAHYYSYHLGAAYFKGKRVFAVMNDGFGLQHHAMEFDKTYALGVGKTFSEFVIRVQYIYQRAEELPIKNENVEVDTLSLMINYKF